jgi:hypothetical protein
MVCLPLIEQQLRMALRKQRPETSSAYGPS